MGEPIENGNLNNTKIEMKNKSQKFSTLKKDNLLQTTTREYTAISTATSTTITLTTNFHNNDDHFIENGLVMLPPPSFV